MEWTSVAARHWGRKAAWIEGDGPFALLARCRDLTVMLFATRGEAEEKLRVLNRRGCGGLCAVDTRDRPHVIIDLSKPRKSN